VAVSILECLSLEEAGLLLKKAKGWLKSDGRIFAKMLAQEVPSAFEHPGVETKTYLFEDLAIIFNGYETGVAAVAHYMGNFTPVSYWIISATKVS